MGKQLNLVLDRKQNNFKIKITKPSLSYLYFDQQNLFDLINLKPKNGKNKVRCESGYVVVTLVKQKSGLRWPSLAKAQGQRPTEGEWSEHFPYLMEEFLDDDDEQLKADFERQFLLELARGN